MIIKQLNPITIDKIVSHDELLKLTELEQYLAHQKQTAEQMIKDTQATIDQAVETQRSATISELQDHNQQLLDASTEKLKQVLDNLNNNLYTIITQILTKCGVLEVDHRIIKELIASELARFTDLGTLYIKAHPDTIDNFQQNLNLVKNTVVFEADASLDPETCICETNLWVMNLKISEVRTKILQFLDSPVDTPEA